MSSYELLHQGLVLSAIGVVGLAASARGQGLDSPSPSAASPNDRDRSMFRVRHGVRPLQAAEEGNPVEGLPNGVYGFSYSPASEAIPLFARHSLQSFEIHKAADGEVHILGYLGSKQAEELKSGGPAEVRLYPDAYGEATELTAIPLDAIVRSKGPSRSEGNYLTATVQLSR